MHEYAKINGNDTAHRSVSISKFMVGAVVGAGIALLLAPANGSDTRRRVGSTVKRIGGGARQVFQRTRDRLKDLREDAQSAIETGREEFARTRQDSKARRAASSPAI